MTVLLTKIARELQIKSGNILSSSVRLVHILNDGWAPASRATADRNEMVYYENRSVFFRENTTFGTPCTPLSNDVCWFGCDICCDLPSLFRRDNSLKAHVTLKKEAKRTSRHRVGATTGSWRETRASNNRTRGYRRSG